jgi:hypothetical protein
MYVVRWVSGRESSDSGSHISLVIYELCHQQLPSFIHRRTRTRINKIWSSTIESSCSKFELPNLRYLTATKRTLALFFHKSVYSTRPRPMGNTLRYQTTCEMSPFSKVHYMIFESEQCDLQVSRPFGRKAESSRNAKTNSAATPMVRLTFGYWSLGFRQPNVTSAPC